MKQPNQVEDAFGDKPTQQEEASFGDILTQFEQEQHEHAAHDAPGQTLQGTVVGIQDDNVIVDIGRKTEGVVAIADVRDDNGEVLVKPGDTITVTLTGRSGEYYTLSTVKAERPKDWSSLQEAFAEGRIIGGRVIEQVKGGLRVDVGARAFMPASRSGARDVPDMEKLVGQEIRCKITKLDVEKDDIVVDRRVVLEQEEKERREAALASVQEGQVIRGTVKTLMDFGAFIDIGGVDGLLHVTDMSWTRVNKPSDLLKPGDQVEVKVLKVNPENRKISLGMKQLQPDPWTVASQNFKVGDRVRGTVARLTDFGAFVNLAPGVDGLVHVSEMSWSKKVRKPADVVSVGDGVEVVVLGVNPADKRISLGLKQALGDPWEEAEQKYAVGSIVEGPVTNMTNFGAFVDLGGGIEGMIHVGDITREKRLEHPKEVLQAGKPVRAQVLEFDRGKRRIRLGMKQLEPTSTDHYIAEHQVGEIVTGRVVDVKGDRAKVELGDGVMGICKLPQTEAPEQPKAAAAEKRNAERADVLSAAAMLAAKFKSGAGAPAAQSEQPPPDRNAVKPGQVRNFKIANLDAAEKRVQLELAP
ncbi:MAG TPA: 30S ribosomal protein S1 [Bryobacteraceae bacterium]|nr:30S ribosomal protein S1 [Bryobacteraceae bacterium]